MSSPSAPSSLTPSDRKFLIKAIVASAVLSAVLFGGLMLIAQKAILNKVLGQMEEKTSIDKDSRTKSDEDEATEPPGRSSSVLQLQGSQEY